MPYRNMSLAEFARHVGMDARQVQRLADRGKLPGHKVGGQWRFNRARVTEWLQQEMHALDEARLIALERSMGRTEDGASGSNTTIVTDLIGLDGIEVNLRANTRASVLRELVGLAEQTGLLYDPKGLLNALEAREGMCSTALPNGVAVPHPRQPMEYASAEPLICVGRLSRGIGFGASSGDLTRLFFLVCCHEDRHHLRVLARLMRILDAETIENLMDAETREEVLGILIRKEEQTVRQTA
jgi:PTS system nitrogen regulatory IIA component